MTENNSFMPVTVTVTGAAGGIAYASLFRIAAGEMLGSQVPIRLKLLEVPSALRSAEGVAMELTDCAFDTVESIEVFDNPYEAFKDCNVALLIGAKPRGRGMNRSDLITENAHIFAEQGRAIGTSSADDVRVVVVGNPANTNALICASHAPDVPVQRFTALTRLDHNRAVAQLALAAETKPRNISGVSIWGNHSDTQYPNVVDAQVNGERALDVLARGGKDEQWVQQHLIPKVAQRGGEIIEVRGGSSVGSASVAALEHVNRWLSEWRSSTSIAVPTDGSYGIEPGLVCSFPVHAGRGVFSIDRAHQLSPLGQERFAASVAELKREREQVESLGLVGQRDWNYS